MAEPGPEASDPPGTGRRPDQAAAVQRLAALIEQRRQRVRPSPDLTPSAELAAIRKAGRRSSAAIDRIRDAWVEVAGEQLARSVWPDNVRGGTLTVAADDAASAFQIRRMADEFAQGLRDRGCGVKRIRVSR